MLGTANSMTSPSTRSACPLGLLPGAFLLSVVGASLACTTKEERVVRLAPMELSAPDASPDIPPPQAVLEKLWDGEAVLPEELRDTPPFGGSVQRATCGKRAGCKVMREKAAGKDALGRALSVVVLELYEMDGMSTREYWALVRDRGALVARARIAQESVGSSYSALQTLRITPNALTTWYDWWPTSNWQSYPWRTFQLWPPRMIGFSDTPHHRGGEAVSGANDLQLTDASGQGWYLCDGRRGDYAPIPEAKLAEGLDPAKGLGRCSVRVDGSKRHGWMLAGASEPSSGHFLVAKLDALYVEVHDDRWTPGDAIELHVGRPAGFMQCFDELAAAVVHVVAGDGKTTAPAGAPRVKVERLSDGDGVRVFRIDDLPTLTGITVVQRDDDDDGRPLRRIATSPLGTSPELGDVVHTGAVCAKTEDGPALVPFFEPSSG